MKKKGKIISVEIDKSPDPAGTMARVGGEKNHNLLLATLSRPGGGPRK